MNIGLIDEMNIVNFLLKERLLWLANVSPMPMASEIPEMPVIMARMSKLEFFKGNGPNYWLDHSWIGVDIYAKPVENGMQHVVK